VIAMQFVSDTFPAQLVQLPQGVASDIRTSSVCSPSAGADRTEKTSPVPNGTPERKKRAECRMHLVEKHSPRSGVVFGDFVKPQRRSHGMSC